jgi:hypothetical protein
MPTAPLIPNTAIEIKLLHLYRSLNKFHRRLGLQPFVRAIHDFHGFTHISASAQSFSKGYDCYLRLQRLIDKRINQSLGRIGEDERLKHACSACFYKLEAETPLPHSFLCAADGNMSLRRFAKVGTADTNVFDSSYILPADNVNSFAGVAQVRPGKKGGAATQDEQREEDLQDATIEISDPTASSTDRVGGGVSPAEDPLAETFAGLVSDCVERWKANGDDDKKVMWDCFHECGIFITICRHGIVLITCDIIKSGEL